MRSGSSINSSTLDQATTLRNEEIARNEIALTDQISEESGNNIQTLPVPFDINTLPNELPTREGRSLRREWFTDFTNHHNICSSAKYCITLYRLDTLRYISKNKHYVIITTGTVSFPASLLVVPVDKAFNGMTPSLCSKQVVGPSSLPVMVAQSDERHANRA